MGKVRFENLVLLLRDMERKGWCIDSFPFTYNGVKTVVILKLYQEKKKPNEYAKVELEFINAHDVEKSIHAYADLFEVHFRGSDEFIKFFNISGSGLNKVGIRAIFIAFSEKIAKYIPREKIVEKRDPLEKKLLGGRAEGNDPDAVYIIDVRRVGTRADGSLKERTIENSNKAATLNKRLYELYSPDRNMSFFYSDREEDEKSDEEIIQMVAKRRY